MIQSAVLDAIKIFKGFLTTDSMTDQNAEMQLYCHSNSTVVVYIFHNLFLSICVLLNIYSI